MTDESEAAVQPAVPSQKKQRRVGLPSPSARRRWGMNPEDRMRVMEACLVLPGSGWITHFVLMMAMSVIVAIMGLSANSAALVIGAMLIAPLMTPVLGIAASIAMALGDAVTRSVITVVLATIGAISVAYVIAGFLPGDPLTTEVLARTAPDARDLVVALAAGVAGSYATARPDVSSSLPGVAIAVALVPPLAVVGITMRAGQGDLALGALLLYATNLAAIVTVSTVVFILAGFVPGRRLASMAPRVIAGGLTALVVVAILGVLLGSRSYQSGQRSSDLNDIRAATETWLDGTFNEFEVDVEDDNIVRVTVTGPTQLPSSAPLKAQVEEILGEPADMRVTWIQGKTNESLQAEERTATQRALINNVVEEWLASGGDRSVYDLTALDIDSEILTLSISSTVAPPELVDLEARLTQALGEETTAIINFDDRSSDESQRLITEAEASARAIVQSWANERDVTVDAVTYDGARLVVNLQGEVAPDGAELEGDLRETLSDTATINVYFIERTPVIPAPTPTATPVPTPTATPVPTPTATPVPTPTPLPDDGSAGPTPEPTP